MCDNVTKCSYMEPVMFCDLYQIVGMGLQQIKMFVTELLLIECCQKSGLQ